MKSETEVKASLVLLILDLIFFLIIRREFTSIYSIIVPGGLWEATAILIGLIVAVASSIVMLRTVYKEARKMVE